MASCQVCNCSSFKVLSKEKFSQIIKCEECGSEYIRVTATDQIELRKRVEKEIKENSLEFKERK